MAMNADIAETEAQRAILETVRRFVRDEVSPVADELDRRDDPAQCFSWEIVEKADAAGIRTMTLTEEWGGIGADSLTTAMVIEELAKGDMGIAVVMAQTLKLAQALQKTASPEQRQKYLPRFRDDPRCLLAIGITEPETASNYFIHHAAPFHTAAERTDGGWLINGMKHFISNGNRAGLYLLFAQTEKNKGLADGSTCFLVERDTPGFSIGRIHDKMGERLANNAELVFDNCFVPDANVIGVPGEGFQVLGRFFPQMCMLNDVSRAYIHRAAWLADNPDAGWDKTLGALPKVFASQSAWKVITWASEIHGGYGYMRDVGLEKLLRDAAAFLHSDGVNRTLLLKAANFMYSD
jgi:alkylation response protein AidB-like acyl-CoA dehydrogenase